MKVATGAVSETLHVFELDPDHMRRHSSLCGRAALIEPWDGDPQDVTCHHCRLRLVHRGLL